MPRVGRIHVAVEIVDDDGSTTIHEAVGAPKPGRGVTANLVPHHRSQYSRSAGAIVATEVVEVAVRLDAVLVEVEGSRLFSVESTPPEVVAIAEAPRAIPPTSG